jgi:hypothetical protein
MNGAQGWHLDRSSAVVHVFKDPEFHLFPPFLCLSHALPNAVASHLVAEGRIASAR